MTEDGIDQIEKACEVKTKWCLSQNVREGEQNFG